MQEVCQNEPSRCLQETPPWFRQGIPCYAPKKEITNKSTAAITADTKAYTTANAITTIGSTMGSTIKIIKAQKRNFNMIYTGLIGRPIQTRFSKKHSATMGVSFEQASHPISITLPVFNRQVSSESHFHLLSILQWEHSQKIFCFIPEILYLMRVLWQTVIFFARGFLDCFFIKKSLLITNVSH